MLQTIYSIYTHKYASPSMDRLYVRIILRLANILMPVYYRITAFLFPGFKLNVHEPGKKPGYIVSLTSFPVRIGKVWLTIESILHQKVKPDMLILWLYRGEFDETGTLPKSLERLKKRGLQIRFCNDNLMPHKKYYYTLLAYPKACLITIDDDVLYPPDFLDRMIRYNQLYPESICCTRARMIRMVDNQIRPYNEWVEPVTDSLPSYANLAIGAGGTLYPPDSLHTGVLDKEELIRLALETDDLWLKVMSLRNHTKVATLSGTFPRPFIPVIVRNNRSLMDKNIGKGQNDKVFQKLIDFYRIPVSIFEPH